MICDMSDQSTDQRRPTQSESALCDESGAPSTMEPRPVIGGGGGGGGGGVGSRSVRGRPWCAGALCYRWCMCWHKRGSRCSRSVVRPAAVPSAWRVSQLSLHRKLHCAFATGNERRAGRIQMFLLSLSLSLYRTYTMSSVHTYTRPVYYFLYLYFLFVIESKVFWWKHYGSI